MFRGAWRTVEIKTMEFVDDIADPNNGYFEALKSNQTISSIQKRKCLIFSAEKCKILKIMVQTTPIHCFLWSTIRDKIKQFYFDIVI